MARRNVLSLTEAINTMLAALSELCADGSSLVFDYPDENFFDASEKSCAEHNYDGKSKVASQCNQPFSIARLKTPGETWLSDL